MRAKIIWVLAHVIVAVRANPLIVGCFLLGVLLGIAEQYAPWR